LSSAVVKIPPAAIAAKLSVDLRTDPIDHAAWRALPRLAIAETDKHRSIVQHFVDGRPWRETDLFTRIYPVRFARGETVRGCDSLEALEAQYDERVDALYADMRRAGFRDLDAGDGSPIPVYVDHEDRVLLGNQGNHRLAIAQVLALPFVLAEIVGRHPDSAATFPIVREAEAGPELPACARAIPAMTTEAERLCYYRLVRAAAPDGAVVELGAWLGAATAYIAAGIRDAGVATRAQVFDRFIWKPASHDKKAGGPIGRPPLEALTVNLGPLMAHVDARAAEIARMSWTGGRVAVLICDAPKRIPAIAHVLATFAPALQPGALMAWQDFAYFPSYDIPAALTRLGDAVELVEAVYPGTTAVFRVRRAWRPADVSPAALALTRWTADEVDAVWAAWEARLPAPMRPRFGCGAAMFLCDLGAVDRARARLRALIAAFPGEVLPKWRYLQGDRGPFMRQRYAPLLEVLP